MCFVLKGLARKLSHRADGNRLVLLVEPFKETKKYDLLKTDSQLIQSQSDRGFLIVILVE
ncbi:MAG: hypothetical protein HC930_00560 [Hydrococcus sp. SU_1_0]|nr:hypothetical protein [Hydrococcus sp. SU_1_0]